MNISLTDHEISLFQHLLALAHDNGLNVTMRVAGGWVRDKLLGLESDDIDIALDTMTGQQFCKAVGLVAAVVTAKPDQSKHLEAAIVDIMGQRIEIVNLRDESWAGSYANDDNRIPTENRFGTPKIDAERRDLTVNALFYNLSTNQVEDYTTGTFDLGFDGDERETNSIRLRTPLDPVITFTDDPLRMLRTMRFFAKLPNSFLQPNVVKAFLEPSVQHAFINKVSAERIAVELMGKKDKEEFKSGIFHGDRFYAAVNFMFTVGLLDIILDVPLMKDFKPFDMDQHSSHHKFNVFIHTIEVMKALAAHPHYKSLSPERRGWLMLACLLHDMGKRDPKCCQLRDDGYRSYKGHEDSSAEVARQICNKLRLSDEAKDYVVKVVGAHMRPHGSGWGNARTLRRFRHEFPDCWEDIIVHAECDAIGSGKEREPGELEHYRSCLARGRELVLAEVNAPPTNKPIIPGDVVMRMIPELPARTGFIRDVNAALLEIRLERPETTEEEYLAKIMEMKPGLLAKYV